MLRKQYTVCAYVCIRKRETDRNRGKRGETRQKTFESMRMGTI